MAVARESVKVGRRVGDIMMVEPMWHGIQMGRRMRNIPMTAPAVVAWGTTEATVLIPEVRLQASVATREIEIGLETTRPVRRSTIEVRRRVRDVVMVKPMRYGVKVCRRVRHIAKLCLGSAGRQQTQPNHTEDQERSHNSLHSGVIPSCSNAQSRAVDCYTPLTSVEVELALFVEEFSDYF